MKNVEEDTQKTYLVSDIDQDIINITTLTLGRLIKLGFYHLALYMFYIYHAKRQKTNSVYVTNTFCMKGLSWGKDKFYKIKKDLIEEGLISPKVIKDYKNRVVTHLIQVN